MAPPVERFLARHGALLRDLTLRPYSDVVPEPSVGVQFPPSAPEKLAVPGEYIAKRLEQPILAQETTGWRTLLSIMSALDYCDPWIWIGKT
jgi:hypothetical protein